MKRSTTGPAHALARLRLEDRPGDELRSLLAYLSGFAPEAVHHAIDEIEGGR